MNTNIQNPFTVNNEKDFSEMQHPILTLCGSSSLKDRFLKLKLKLSLAGCVVFDLPVYSKCDNITLSSDELTMLKILHKKKIEYSDLIAIVIDESWTIGRNTYDEYKYAISINKPVCVISMHSVYPAIYSIEKLVYNSKTEKWLIVPDKVL